MKPEQVKRTFEEAYRANSQALGNSQDAKNTAKNGGVEYSLVSIDGKYYKPDVKTLISKHPTITPIRIDSPQYHKGVKMSNAEYAEYRHSQAVKAKENYGIYINKDKAYSDKYGEIRADFGQKAVNKAKSYGGIALYDIVPHVGEIFENAVVVETKADRNNDTNIRGVVDLVGCAILGDGNHAVIKLNVIEYVNENANIYDNRVIKIEELTVVGGVGHQIIDGSTSPTVSSNYIISAYYDLVNRQNSLSKATNTKRGASNTLRRNLRDVTRDGKGRRHTAQTRPILTRGIRFPKLPMNQSLRLSKASWPM